MTKRNYSPVSKEKQQELYSKALNLMRIVSDGEASLVDIKIIGAAIIHMALVQMVDTREAFETEIDYIIQEFTLNKEGYANSFAEYKDLLSKMFTYIEESPLQ